MTQSDQKTIPYAEQEQHPGDESIPVGLRRPLTTALTRMLAGRSLDEEILDPANPNLQWERTTQDHA
ncbi:MAG: hypothetical protein G8237_10370 [Magnetococcales bacterium]|nr:hypothetical protein [Magnetococcales bacterium]NGZ06750.1 hypothetical protein [Magnetococcales bacterium]